MATNKLYPAYAQILYSSAFGNHVMTLPMRAVTTTGLGDPGMVTNWDTTLQGADSMVDNFISAAKACVPNTHTFLNYTIFRVPGVGLPGEPIFTKAVTSGVGTETGLTGQSKAVQVTIGFLTTNFGHSRVVLLDRPVNGNFGNFVDPTGDLAGIINAFKSDANAWAGRDDSQPLMYTNTSICLNKRLRRKYDMI